MGEEQKIKKEIDELFAEHQELDKAINQVSTGSTFDQLLVQRLKRRKLQIKDKISQLRSLLCEDIIA